MKQMEEIGRDGKLTLTDYFGKCPGKQVSGSADRSCEVIRGKVKADIGWVLIPIALLGKPQRKNLLRYFCVFGWKVLVKKQNKDFEKLFKVIVVTKQKVRYTFE